MGPWSSELRNDSDWSPLIHLMLGPLVTHVYFFTCTPVYIFIPVILHVSSYTAEPRMIKYGVQSAHFYQPERTLEINNYNNP